MGYYIELEVKGELTEEGVQIFNKIKSGSFDTDIGRPYVEIYEKNGFYLRQYERYEADRKETYERFVKKFLVPLTTEITNCCISDDFLCDYNYHYFRDDELRKAHYSVDDELRKAHYIVAYTEPQPPTVQYGKRVVAMKSKPKLLSYTKIYPMIYDSDVDTWPIGLRGVYGWWSSLNKENALEISDALIKYYPDDEYLIKTADWINEVMDEFSDVEVKFQYTFGLKDYEF